MSGRKVHWFRRDLRLDDNTGWWRANADGSPVAGLFIFDDALLAAAHTGATPVDHLLGAVESLARQFEQRGAQLYIRRGHPAEIVPQFAAEVGASLVTWNEDYSPYARRRDAEVAQACDARGLATEATADLLVVRPGTVRKDDGGVPSVFSAFARRWRAGEIARPVGGAKPAPADVFGEVDRGILPSLEQLGFVREVPRIELSEDAARESLARFLDEGLAQYASRRDLPGIAGTSRLSPHLKYGTISARTVLDGVRQVAGEKIFLLAPSRLPGGLSQAESELARQSGTFVNELIWREFYYAILAEHPRVATGAFRKDPPRWPAADPELVRLWKEGRTGFPIVDAAMRQLATTGWMHNRVRMICAMQLTKLMLVDWRVGEAHFRRKLIDGDLAANNGGWQWCASTGTDAAPYFRIFNPWSQSRKFDPEGAFIREYVEELRDAPDDLVHEPHKDAFFLAQSGYPAPCIDYRAARERALATLAPAKE